MNYSETQRQALTEHIKHKLQSNEYKGPQAVVTLVSLIQAGRLTEDQVVHILKEAFKGNKAELLFAVRHANELLSPELIKSIVGPDN